MHTDIICIFISLVDSQISPRTEFIALLFIFIALSSRLLCISHPGAYFSISLKGIAYLYSNYSIRTKLIHFNSSMLFCFQILAVLENKNKKTLLHQGIRF